MLHGLSRREILKLLGLTGLATCFNPFTHPLFAAAKKSRVVMVRDSLASSYGFGKEETYEGKVDQEAVNKLLVKGLRILTGETSEAAAWGVIIPNYKKNQKIAVKVNFNNIFDHWGEGWQEKPVVMNALPETINALVKSLKAFGVREQDIWVYDSSRNISQYFKEKMLYPGVQLWDNSGHEGFNQAHHNLASDIKFQDPNIRQSKICNVLANADYLINMPLLKTHTAAGITLGFKNHFGTISECWELHDWTWPSGIRFSEQYNPLVDICSNPHIKGKTVLVLGDGIFGNYHTHMGPPIKWPQYFDNDSPNCLFFSTDIVAADSVMRDVLRVEKGGDHKAGAAYLPLAEAAGLGIYESGHPFKENGYRKIELINSELLETGENLILDDFSINQDQVSSGDQVVAKASLENSGEKKGLPARVELYLSKNKKLGRKDHHLCDLEFANLPAGSTKKRRRKFQVPNNIKAGKFYLLARIVSAEGESEVSRSEDRIIVS
jgi:uncharacterized protein (DUF362 family)